MTDGMTSKTIGTWSIIIFKIKQKQKRNAPLQDDIVLFIYVFHPLCSCGEEEETAQR